jgi:hypothetical protein
VPSNEKELQNQLECLRLASDLRQLASGTLSAELKRHCLRLAKGLDRADGGVAEGSTRYFYLDS